jgi:hypothetical protein
LPKRSRLLFLDNDLHKMVTKASERVYQIWGSGDSDETPRFRFGKLRYPHFNRSSKQVDWCEFYKGVKLPKNHARHLEWRISEKGGPLVQDFAQFFMGWTLMSRKLRTLLKAASQNVSYQWIEPMVLYPRGFSRVKYQWFNALTHVSCLDFNESEVVFNEDGSLGDIRKLVVKSQTLEKICGIFRLREFPLILLMSGEIHDLFLNHGINGYEAKLIPGTCQ